MQTFFDRVLDRDAVGGRRGLKADRQEDDLLLGMLGRVSGRVLRRVDRDDLAAQSAGGLQALLRAGHADEIAEGADRRVLLERKPDRLVDVVHRGHADRAAGAGDQIDVLRQQLADTHAEDLMGVRAADFHDAQGRNLGVPDDLHRAGYHFIHFFRPSSSLADSSTSPSVIFAIAAPACTMT